MEMSQNEKLFIEKLQEKGYVIKEECMIEATECVDECTTGEEAMTMDDYINYMLSECPDMFKQI
jgi:hypothetical protein